MNHKLFDWENFPHEGRGYSEYSIDFESNEHRPYKQMECVRLYKDGPVEIFRAPYRQPEIVSKLKHHFDLDFRLLSDLGELTLHTHDWTPVRKGSIEGVEMVLLDWRHRVVISPRWRDENVVRYYSPYSWPAGGAEISVGIPDKARAKKLKVVLHGTLALAHTYYTTTDGVRSATQPSADEWVASFLKGECSYELNPGEHSLTLWQLGQHVHNRTIDTALSRWTERKETVRHLRFRRRGEQEERRAA